MCGAVSGAILVVGLKYGNHKVKDDESRDICNAKAEEFINEFRIKNGAIVCRELLGCDISTPNGSEHAIKQDLFHSTCVQMVKDAAEVLEKLGY